MYILVEVPGIYCGRGTFFSNSVFLLEMPGMYIFSHIFRVALLKIVFTNISVQLFLNI